jgi:hypothetical protein
VNKKLHVATETRRRVRRDTLVLTCAASLLLGGATLRAANGPAPVYFDQDPAVASPRTQAGAVVTLTARLADGRFAVVPVGLTEEQRTVDREDFPALARTGLHDEAELLGRTTITGRPLDEITRLGRPGALSSAGFLAHDEEILAVLLADNRRVARMGLTHPELAEPLFHWFNLLETDIGVVWSNHSWDGLSGFHYNGRLVRLKGTGTKGGQQSIFDDGIEGAIDMDLWREPDPDEVAFLRGRYAGLSDEQFELLLDRLFRIHTGEMEPQYIMRYGFYEGHTAYRAEPLAVAVIFGLRTVEEVEAAYPGQLLRVLTEHCTAPAGKRKPNS